MCDLKMEAFFIYFIIREKLFSSATSLVACNRLIHNNLLAC